MRNTVSRVNSRKNDLFYSPGTEHFVQFYTYDHVLVSTLGQYVKIGIQKGETCVVVATRRHVQALEGWLADQGTDTLKARQNQQLITVDAADLLSSCIVDSSIDRKLFFGQVGGLLQKVSQSSKPVRVYGEMVALLWKKGDMQGVLKLEELWDKLAEQHVFALYCAYPMMYFIREVHQPAITEISRRHSLVITDR